jgi:hypothetical protein
MVCRSPAVASRPDAVQIATARVLIRFPDGKGFSPVPCSSRNRSCTFTIHPDPVFADFHVENESVAINAIGSNRGYGADDLTVRFPNTANRCVVTETTPDRVLCAPSSPTVNLTDLTDLVVTVGERLQRRVTRKRIVDGSDWLPLGFSWTIVTAPAVVSVSIIAVLLCFCLGRKQRYDIRTPNDASELRPIYHQSLKPVMS